MRWKNLLFEGSQIRTSPDSECHVCHLLQRGSTGYSHLYLHSEEAVSMTLAHRTPDASSAKIGGGARWIGIHVTLKTTRISFTVTCPRSPSGQML